MRYNRFMDENVKDKIFSALMENFKLEELLSWNEFNIKDKLEKQSFLEVQWRERYITANKKLDELKNEKIELEGIIFEEIRFPQIPEPGKPINPIAQRGGTLSQKEIEKYFIPRDKRIKEINKKIERQQIIVDFFLTAYDAIKGNGWRMKDWIKANNI
jgi:hypothetical protein